MRITLLSLAVVTLTACATTAAAPPMRGTATAGFGQAARVGPLRVTPLALLEDSRCPRGVTCVWAGQVRITARVAGPRGTTTRELTSGKPVAVGSGMLVLDEVAPPSPPPGTKPASSAYRFAFRYAANLMR